MTLEFYKQAMAEMGISRGGLEADAEIEPTHGGSLLLREPTYLNEKASTRAERAPMEELPEHLVGDQKISKKAKAWWANLSPEERKKERVKRARNGSGAWSKTKKAVGTEAWGKTLPLDKALTSQPKQEI